MNSKQILKILKNNKEFSGVYACDQLPQIHSFPAALVANTDPHTKPGTHWVAFYINADGSGEFFDSYGLEPQQFRNFMHKTCNMWQHNTIRLQGPLSSVCGQYCIYYLVHKFRDIPLHSIVKNFDSTNLVANDTLVTQFVNENFNIDLETYDVDFLLAQICRSQV